MGSSCDIVSLKAAAMAARAAPGEAALKKLLAIIADILANDFALVARKRRYRLRELEFYIKAPAFRDPCVHSHARQELEGAWYVHRHGRSEGAPFASFNQRVGLDLALGEPGVPFGILLRAVEDESGRLIKGPIRLLNELYGGAAAYKSGGDLRRYVAASRKLESRGAFDPKGEIFLEPRKQEPRKCKFSPRTGISAARYPASAKKPFKATIE